MELYKYCRREHVETLKDSGILRIGTLYDYQKTDKYGELIADAHEGSKSISGTAKNLDASNIHQYPGLKGLIHLEDGGKVGAVTVSNCTVTCPNLFVFSASQKYSHAEHVRWFEEEGYDACYRIRSARLFFRALSKELSARGQFIGFAPVHYVERFDLASPLAGVHPAIVKRQSAHQSQQEVRALWQPLNEGNVEPIILPVTDIWRYCSLHKVLNGP